MDAAEESNDVVHPEVRAHINSLVSALGGASADDDGSYKLGDDALEVLRDLRKWIRFYDEKTNRMDVARCLAEANIIGGDLLPILATWPENASHNKTKARIALACFELIAPLTWPIEKNPETMTINHHRHLPVLQLAQLRYKRDIINFDGARILHTAVRTALPSMAMPIGDRTPRDSGIIKLMLYFLRNMAMIAPPPGTKFDGDETQISRSATIDAFSYQDIFLTILTIASNMGDDFRTEDVIIMEIIFHLVKRVDIEKLFLDEKQLSKAKTGELTAMINKEAAMLRSFNRNAPTRHNRFGTMVWVKRGDGKMSTITGQDALSSAAVREAKMDKSKNFRPPRRARKEEMEPKDLGLPVSLNARANAQLRSFVEEFLDSGFNPLFQHVRKTIDRAPPHVMAYHRSQFFYLVAWFLEAERVRKKSKKSAKQASQDEVGSFNLVAGVLSQEMFVTLNRALSTSYNDKEWRELTAVMKCFTQILLTVQDMSESGNEEDEEIAENILSRLFYEEATHDAVASLARTYKDQGFEYLDACTDLTHTYLRILEAYSKQNVDMQVRSRKRIRRKKMAAKAAGNVDIEEGDDEADDSADDEQQAEKTSQERKFDFRRFANRFIPQGVVDTFVSFTKYYSDLSDAQLKRAHRYFYRVAFKQEMSVMLFRVDILHQFYNMVKGPEPLDKNCSVFKDWEELVKQLIKRCVRKIEERPALIIEMLFSKINSTAHYLEYGYEKQTISANPRPGAELEFRHIVERAQQIAIAVGVLLDKGQLDHIDWVKRQLMSAESERLAWETAEKTMSLVEDTVAGSMEQQSEEIATVKEAPSIIVRPDTDTRRTAIFKNSHLRLLMKLVGFERLAPTLDETPESVWVIPASLTAAQLKESLDLINKTEFSPPTFENGESAEEQLRRKSAPRKRANFDDDGDDVNDFIDGDDEVLFPAGGPTVRKIIDEDRPKKTRRRRRRSGSEDVEGATEGELNERRKARRQRELEKARRIKSDIYVHASDEESDEERDREFFAREEAIRARINKPVMPSLSLSLGAGAGAPGGSKAAKKNAKNKRKSDALLDGNDEDILGLSSEDSDSTPPPTKKSRKTRKRQSTESAPESSSDEGADVDSDNAAEEASKPTVQRRRKPGGLVFLDDSSDDSDDADADPAQLSSQQSGSAAAGRDVVDGSDDDPMETDDTPLSSSPHNGGSAGDSVRDKQDKGQDSAAVARKTGGDEDHDDDEDGPVKVMPRGRARARAGFIMDSSDEE